MPFRLRILFIFRLLNRYYVSSCYCKRYCRSQFYAKKPVTMARKWKPKTIFCSIFPPQYRQVNKCARKYTAGAVNRPNGCGKHVKPPICSHEICLRRYNFVFMVNNNKSQPESISQVIWREDLYPIAESSIDQCDLIRNGNIRSSSTSITVITS